MALALLQRAIGGLHNVLLAPGVLEALPHGLEGVLNWPRQRGRGRVGRVGACCGPDPLGALKGHAVCV